MASVIASCPAVGRVQARPSTMLPTSAEEGLRKRSGPRGRFTASALGHNKFHFFLIVPDRSPRINPGARSKGRDAAPHASKSYRAKNHQRFADFLINR